MSSCTICHSQRIKIEHRMDSILDIFRCPDCAHRNAKHHPASQNASDYHLQYEQKNFVDSLKQTRIRQANLIYENLRRMGGTVDRVIDVGAGRGWFLETLQKRGVANLVGMENSKIGLAVLEAMKIPGIETDASLKFPSGRVPFAPRIVCFLDILEHFHESIDSLLEPFMESFRDSLEFIVIKVPVSDGILYRIAHGLVRLGWFRPLAQLYQVGTFPPHRQYFSARSLQILAHKNPFVTSYVLGDPDFEPDGFRQRFWSAPKAIREICRVCGGILYYAARFFGLYDSHIIFLDLRSTKTSGSEDLLQRSSRGV